MNEPDLFWTTFAAMMSANLLTVFFVWGIVTYSRHERDGTAGSKESNLPALAFLVPMLLLVAGVVIAFDKVPVWLDAALR